jgi:flavin reductase (DIM6/NTAB) family NADH-FMN oxidoreductase RutF
MKKRSLSLSQVYRLLEPGPVVLLTTADRKHANIMAMSWHMMMEFEPPLVGCLISGRNHSFDILSQTRECVINIPSVELAEKVVTCGNTSGKKIDKFKSFGLTAMPAACVKAPLIAECYADLECRVADARLVNQYNFFILEGLKAWIASPRRDWRTIHHWGMGSFMVAGETLKLPSRMR